MITQAQFDKAVGGVIAQGCSSTELGTCVYLGYKGTKCVIGHLLPRYDPLIENCKPFGLNRQPGQKILNDMLREVGFTEEDTYFLLKLQKCHDNSAFKEYNGNFIPLFKAEAKEICAALGLEWNHGS